MLSTGGPKKGTNLKELSKRNPILVEKGFDFNNLQELPLF
jgi:hypothetical protein